MSGLFSTLNIASRGLSVQQTALDVTSHNISNANTPGYSRQRALMETTTPYSMPGLNSPTEPGQLGTGAQVSAIQRYRDAFLDYQTRVETSTKGQFDTKQTVLGEVESIFNEPSDTGISSLMGKFFDSWQQLSTQPQSSSTRTSVVQQSSALTDALNQTYTQLQDLKTNTQLDTKNTVVDINSKLKQLDLLNQQIRDVSVGGNNANDLMDNRDTLLDQLSTEFNIKVTATNNSGIDLSPVDTPGANFNMINSVETGTEKSLAYISDISADPSTPPTVPPTTQRYNITYYSNGDTSNAANKHTLVLDGVTPQQYQTLDENRTLWTDSNGFAVDATGSEIKDNPSPAAGAGYSFNQVALFQPSDGQLMGDTSVQSDIDGYIDQLNNLAKTLAFSVNAVHSGMADPLNPNVGATATDPTIDNMPFFVNSDNINYGANNVLAGADLTAALANEQNITAGNISVNQQIMSDVSQIKTKTNDDSFDLDGNNTTDGETDGARALAIAQLRDTLINVQDIGGAITRESDMFSATENTFTNNGMTIGNSANGMTMDSYFTDTVDKLGIQSQEAQRMVTNQDSLLANFEQSRTSVSGVSLDEEMANMVQFQHAYQANAKVISTIDELLDVVVNGLKK